MAERTFHWSEERRCFGVDAGEQGPDDRFVPSVLEEGCAQLDGLGAADTAPREGRGVRVPTLLGPAIAPARQIFWSLRVIVILPIRVGRALSKE